MCTVSFYKNNNQTIITSNRDEHYSRKLALPPQEYGFEKFKLIYCKDTQANGTWMTLRNDGTVIVLLNGAFERHVPKYPYRKSRGLVVLDISNAENCVEELTKYDLDDIEPFTMILYFGETLFEFFWDGKEKMLIENPHNEPWLWSSATLYDVEARENKLERFQELLASKNELTKDDILQLHHSKTDLINGFVINRNEQLLTFSVTQVVLTPTGNTFYHHNLLEDKEYSVNLHAASEKSIL